VRAITTPRKTKHKAIYDDIFHKISSGVYKPGDKIPTEIELVDSFNTSRPTVSRALRDLESIGLIYRIQGSGSFISKKPALENLTLGLLTARDAINPVCPQGPTIFSQIIPQISRFASQSNMALILGNSPPLNQKTLSTETTKICDDFIKRGVKGIFFLPFETTEEPLSLNEMITEKLAAANIQIILLDRDIYDVTSKRSRFDIVGLDNTRASYTLTQHLIEHGCKNICILSDESHNSVINDRIQGYQKAMSDNNLPSTPTKLVRFSEGKIDEARSKLLPLNFDGIVCVNDAIAAKVMNLYTGTGAEIPQKIKIVGFDDLPLAAHLNPPLTTIHQPVNALAEEAVRAMLNRIENPTDPAKDIRIHGEMVIRQSCGCGALQ